MVGYCQRFLKELEAAMLLRFRLRDVSREIEWWMISIIMVTLHDKCILQLSLWYIFTALFNSPYGTVK